MQTAREEAEEIPLEELEAAGKMYDILASEGWAGWKKRNDESEAWIRAQTGTEEAIRASIEGRP